MCEHRDLTDADRSLHALAERSQRHLRGRLSKEKRREIAAVCRTTDFVGDFVSTGLAKVIR